MRKFKDSGIEWVGEIPADWEMRKARYMFIQRFDKGNSIELQLLSPTPNYGVIPQWKYEELSGMVAVKLNEKADLMQLKTVHKGDFCISLRSFQGGFEYSKYEGVVSPAYQVFYPVVRIDDGYYKYMFKDRGFIEKMNSYTMTLRDGKNISFFDFGNTYIPYPPIAKQQTIAAYLDRKCSEIDALKANIQSEIETLEEYKRSVITEAVTKGLDPNVKMKDSGVRWVGLIPSHWNMIPFKYVLSERSENNNPVKSNDRLSLSIGLGITLYSEKTTNLDRFKDDVSQYKLAYVGDLVMNSMNVIVGAVGVTNYFGCVSPAYYCFYDDEPDNITSKFCEYIFLSKGMRNVLFRLGKGIMAIDRGDGKVNTCRLKVSKYDIGHLPIPVPPIKEQRRIVEYANQVTDEINAIISDREKQIETLEEYKKSLIYEYVTGKKEVL